MSGASPREHEHVFVGAPPFLRELRRVARAALFALQIIADSGSFL